MKKALLLFFLPLAVAAAGPGLSFAQAPSEPAVEQAEAPKPAKKKARKKAAKKAPAAAAEAAAVPAEAPPQEAPKPRAGKRIQREPVGSVSAARPVLKTLDKKKANALLYSTMEKLETLLALYDNLQLQVSEDTVNKAAELESAANRAAADFFRTEAPDPGRETVKAYKSLLNSTLRSLKVLLDVKDRVIPEETEKALALCGDLKAAIEGELALAKLKGPGSAPAKEPEAPAAAQGDDEDSRLLATPVTEPPVQGETILSGEAGALATLSELRKALQAYKREEGKYPKKLNKLTPKYIPEMPAISVADHSTTDEVLEIDSEDYDDNLHQAITDSGKWLYFTSKKSKYYGQVFIDCSHKNGAGVELFRAGDGK